MNDLLIARVGGQFGAFTTADAQRLRLDPLSLNRLLTSGDIVGPRAYVDGRLHRGSTPQQRHALDARAIVRSLVGRAVGTSGTAAVRAGDDLEEMAVRVFPVETRSPLEVSSVVHRTDSKE